LRSKLKPRSLDHISSLKGQISQLVYQICIYNSNMCITCSVFLTLPLRKYISDPDHAVIIKSIVAIEGLVFQGHPIQILHYRIKQLSIKQIPLIKLLWANHTSSETT